MAEPPVIACRGLAASMASPEPLEGGRTTIQVRPPSADPIALFDPRPTTVFDPLVTNRAEPPRIPGAVTEGEGVGDGCCGPGEAWPGSPGEHERPPSRRKPSRFAPARGHLIQHRPLPRESPTAAPPVG